MESSTFLHQSWPRRFVDGMVDAAAAEQSDVRGVDDGIDFELCYVVLDCRDGVVEFLVGFREASGLGRRKYTGAVEGGQGWDIGKGFEFVCHVWSLAL